MLTYQDILRLEPQNPGTETFSLSDLVWSKVKDRNIDNVAVIPHCRVKDFVKGECSRGECAFSSSSSKRRKEGVQYAQRIDGVLESEVYQCTYGPDDHREGGETRNSRKCKKQSEKNGCGGRPYKMIGCQCHFTVKQRVYWPDRAIIIYNHQKHVTKSGSACHGLPESGSACHGLPESGSACHELPEWNCKKKRTKRRGELKGGGDNKAVSHKIV